MCLFLCQNCHLVQNCTHQVLSWVEVQASVVCLSVALRQPDSDDIKTSRGLHTCTGIFRFNTEDRYRGSIFMPTCMQGLSQKTKQGDQTSQQTQNICMTFVQCWTNIFNVGSTLCKCHTNVLLRYCIWWWLNNSLSYSARCHYMAVAITGICWLLKIFFIRINLVTAFWHGLRFGEKMAKQLTNSVRDLPLYESFPGYGHSIISQISQQCHKVHKAVDLYCYMLLCQEKIKQFFKHFSQK